MSLARDHRPVPRAQRGLAVTQVELPLPLAGDWLELLRQEVRVTNMTCAAKRIGVSRPVVSGVLSGKYGAKTNRVAIKVLKVLGGIQCPALGSVITSKECQENRTRKAPTHSPSAMQLFPRV